MPVAVNVSVNYDSSSLVVSFDPSTPVTLQYSQPLNVNVGSGFPPGSYVDAILVHSVVNQNGVDSKGPFIGIWYRRPPPGGNQTFAGISIATNDLNVTITDSDASTSDYKYWYGVVMTDPSGTNYSGDPELLVKKLGTGRFARGA